MDLNEFKKEVVKAKLGIDSGSFGTIFSFIDFGNVTYWFEDDIRGADKNLLPPGNKLAIDLEKLKDFTATFSAAARFYFGHDPLNEKSLGFILKAKNFFGKHNAFSKNVQRIKHYLKPAELASNTRHILFDKRGPFIFIPKCNFDVEISVDAIRLADKYDTLCLFSGDADFLRLIKYLKEEKSKKTILIKGGYIQKELAEAVDLIINAQDIKSYITRLKAKI